MLNHWELSGEIVRIKESEAKHLAVVVTIRGASHSTGVSYSPIVELQTGIEKDVWKKLLTQGVQAYSVVKLEGHIETHIKVSGDKYNFRQKIVFAVDDGEVLQT